jgi:nitrate reductase NapD
MNPDPQAACLDVSGIVVHADPAAAAEVRDALGRIEGVTVHAVSPQGKIVATVETASEAASAERFERIGALAGVLATAMVYHQIESDPDQEVT